MCVCTNIYIHIYVCVSIYLRYHSETDRQGHHEEVNPQLYIHQILYFVAYVFVVRAQQGEGCRGCEEKFQGGQLEKAAYVVSYSASHMCVCVCVCVYLYIYLSYICIYIYVYVYI